MPDEFQSGTDWECSSGPIITRAFDASADLWPHGLASEFAGGDKDVLADGLHPVLAIGPKAQRPRNLTGVVVTYNAANDRAEMNLADKVCVKQYVANNASYSGTTPAGLDLSLAIGQPVYVDDSDALAAGVTLSLSPLNHNADANPLAGYIWYCQDDYDDSGVGGHTAARAFPIVITEEVAVTYTELCILLVNDFGIGNVDPTP